MNRRWSQVAAALLAAFALPSFVFAAAYGGASGQNSRGGIVHILGDIPDKIYVQRGKDWPEEYDLRAECPGFTDTEISCRSTGKSPLAGVTYKVTTSKKYRPCKGAPYFDKSPGEVYVCVKGCGNPRAPRIMYVSPWEC